MQIPHLYLRYPLNRVHTQRIEYDSLVNTIQEFRTELQLQRFHHLITQLVPAQFLFHKWTRNIGSHNNNSILEVHGSAMAISKPPIV